MKKVVGYFNLIFGIFEIICGAFYTFITIPRLSSFHKSFNTNLTYNFNALYLYFTMLIIFGVISTVIGAGNLGMFFKKKSKLVYYTGIFFNIFPVIVLITLLLFGLNKVII